MRRRLGCTTAPGSDSRSLENSLSCMVDASGSKVPSAQEADSSSPFRSNPEGLERNGSMKAPYVLIVEDNENASGALRVLFEATGHRVAIAATVAEATA